MSCQHPRCRAPCQHSPWQRRGQTPREGIRHLQANSSPPDTQVGWSLKYFIRSLADRDSWHNDPSPACSGAMKNLSRYTHIYTQSGANIGFPWLVWKRIQQLINTDTSVNSVFPILVGQGELVLGGEGAGVNKAEVALL